MNKNLFQSDEENTMISLDPVLPTSNIFSNSQPNFSKSNEDSSNSAQSNKKSTKLISGQSMFNQLNPDINQQSNESSQLNEDDDPPLLQDIGIDLQKIKKRVLVVLTLDKADRQLIQHPDLSGPIIISLALGCLLLLGGKIHFSDIEAAFIIGSIIMYLLFNFMARNDIVSLYSIMSFLGYSLIPMLILAFFGIFITLTGTFGIILSLTLAGWSSYSSGNLISVLLNRQQAKALLIYPLFLFYISFAMIIIF